MNSGEQTPFEVLKTEVYPVINQTILKLIDHIVKSEQVQKHEQRLRKKKIIDELEKKYIERQIQKQQLGSDYEESDDQEHHKMLGMTKQQVQTLVWKRIEKAKNKQLDQTDYVDSNIFDPIDFIIKQLKNTLKNKNSKK